MKKSSISRRDFMKGLATGALSVAIVPPWSGEKDMTPGRAAAIARNEQKITSLPPFFDCNKYFGPGFPQHPDFPRATRPPGTYGPAGHRPHSSLAYFRT